MSRKSIQLSRRAFLKIAGATGAGLAIAIYLDACAPINLDLIEPTQTATNYPSFTWEPSIYFRIDTNGILTVRAFRSEMGQGIR
ncbi:MAG: twin-arginine translocation signal domain-containing protein, partial [Bacteroidota bacterium]